MWMKNTKCVNCDLIIYTDKLIFMFLHFHEIQEESFHLLGKILQN